MCNRTLYLGANGNILSSDRCQSQYRILRLIDLLLLPVARAGLQFASCGNANTRLTNQYSLSLCRFTAAYAQKRSFWTMIER
jgi:hypothetical protein